MPEGKDKRRGRKVKKFDNYSKNLRVLSTAGSRDLSDEFIVSGIIDKFYIQFELSWKLFKQLLKYEGRAVANTGSPRQIIKEMYAVCEFIDEDIWLGMLNDRNETAHIYDGNAARILALKIIESYVPEFIRVEQRIRERYINTGVLDDE